MTIALISHPDCLLHDISKYHPEQPARLRVIHDELFREGLINSILKEYSAQLVTREQLLRVHDGKYIDSIFAISPEKGLISLDPDTWMNPYTLQAALRAAGAAILGVDLVMSNEVGQAFCNVRPPGHHAEKAKAMGFCLFNNVAVGVAHALEHHKLNRVAIVDFDVHHGNGTEDIFRDDKRVLYCSSFESPFYPFSGTDTKSKHILNVPLPAGTPSNIFREKVEESWFQKITQFAPEIIFFSAGFDGFIHDEISDLLLTEEDYGWLTRKIKEIADHVCKGRIVSVLEGGYDLNGLGQCVAAHIRELFNK
jgi:acetoin utilization deacetylase AcuC-like enzyme